MDIGFPGLAGGASLTNFPAVVILDKQQDGFYYTQFASPAGGDLRFTDAAETRWLPHEIESWDTNGQSCVWVRIPHLTNGTTVRAFWGNPGALEPPASCTNGEVWIHGYQGVWHLGETPEGTNAQTFTDSTTNRHRAEGNVFASVTNGPADGAQEFGGLYDSLNAAPAKDAVLSGTGSQFTISCWVKPGRLMTDHILLAKTRDGTGGTEDRVLELKIDEEAKPAFVWYDGETSNCPASFGSTAIADTSRWYSIAVVHDGTVAASNRVSLYVNGEPESVQWTSDVGIASAATNPYVQFFVGTMDEIRISHGCRSMEWLNACWLNLASNSVFTVLDPGDDSDEDGLLDYWELYHFTNLNEVGAGNPDVDTLHNLFEFMWGTDPNLVDTDGDGMQDGIEILYGFSPVVPNVYTPLPFLERFETNTVLVGMLDGQHGWTVAPPSGGMVQTDTVYQGDQALELDAGSLQEATVQHLFAAPAAAVVWFETYVRPVPAATPDSEMTDGVAMFFNTNGFLTVHDGLQPEGSRWVTLTNHAPVSTSDWVRIDAKLDYGEHTWLVCLDGVLLARGLGFATNAPAFSSLELEGARGFFDNVTIRCLGEPDLKRTLLMVR